jgi:hypothetical protein
VLDGLQLQADEMRHLVLDLLMDVSGLYELIEQNEYARENEYACANPHNLAVSAGPRRYSGC